MSLVFMGISSKGQIGMVAAQAKSVNLPAGLLARLSQSFDELVPVDIVEENIVSLMPRLIT